MLSLSILKLLEILGDLQLTMAPVSNQFWQNPTIFHHHLALSKNMAQHSENIE
jgi:hypothetical protein